MISSFARRVARAIRRRGLWSPGDRIAVACSGGADSVALLLALAELAVHADWALAGVIHVNHGLRGPESDEDEAFCRALGARLGLPVEVVAVNVREARSRGAQSIEAAARDARYAAFATASGALSASVVATAHTADDQAETVLLRLIGGSGTRGVSAIRARRAGIARPLIDLERREVLAYLEARGQAYREDSSNRDVSIPRNRLRHTLMPLLVDQWPGAVAALGRFADLSAADEAWLSAASRRLARRVVRITPAGVQLKRDALARLPGAVARRVVRDAIEAAGGRPSLHHVDALLRLARSDRRNRRLHLSGLTLACEPDHLLLARRGTGDDRRTGSVTAFAETLDVPGQVAIGETGVVVRASMDCSGNNVHPARSAGAVVAIQADRVGLPLTVRSRRPGDRMRPLGAPGSRKVQDLLVDRKIPCTDRAAVPIVEDARGRVLWVAGVAVAEWGRVTRPEAGVVILEITKDRT